MTETDSETINLHRWCSDRAAAFRSFARHEWAAYPDDTNRDDAIVEWVLRALGNPLLAESVRVLAELTARHGLSLTPTVAEAVAA